MKPMTQYVYKKAKGGRGMKSDNKYERFTITVPPEVLVIIEAYAAAKQFSRSEAITSMLIRHEKVWPILPKK